MLTRGVVLETQVCAQALREQRLIRTAINTGIDASKQGPSQQSGLIIGNRSRGIKGASGFVGDFVRSTITRDNYG